MNRPLVSIVVPSLDQRPFVERTLDSILSQRGDFDLEVLVQDAGSTDGTREILEARARARGHDNLVVICADGRLLAPRLFAAGSLAAAVPSSATTPSIIRATVAAVPLEMTRCRSWGENCFSTFPLSSMIRSTT